MLRRLFAKSSTSEPSPPSAPITPRGPARVPEGVRVYAIGDVHGRVDLVRAIEERIREDAASAPPGIEITVVYLGDFVDRGFESRATIEHLARDRDDDVAWVYLMGNHDQWFRAFMEDSRIGGSWFKHGGDATLLSYGVRLPMDQPEDARLEDARRQLVELTPKRHVDFLDQLDLAFSIGDYFFAHAGVDPRLPFAQQTERELLWIREPFLDWGEALDKVVVHGHTVEEQPMLRAHRIGVDTGACWTGMLTCLVLERDHQRFLVA